MLIRSIYCVPGLTVRVMRTNVLNGYIVQARRFGDRGWKQLGGITRDAFDFEYRATQYAETFTRRYRNLTRAGA